MQPEIVAARDSTTVPVKKPFGKAGDFASVSFLLLHELPHGVAHGFAAAGINATFYQRIQSVNLPFRQTYLNTVHNTPRFASRIPYYFFTILAHFVRKSYPYPSLALLASRIPYYDCCFSLTNSKAYLSAREDGGASTNQSPRRKRFL